MKILLVLFLVATIGGAIRKWFTTSSALSNGILGLQMVLPFMLFSFRSRQSISPFQSFGILYVYFFYLAFHILYPLQLTVFHGLFGALVHGGFWFGIFYYLANRHLFDTSRLMNVFIIIGLLEIILAFVQYQLPQDNWLNKYAREGQSIAVVNDKVRVTGTFSYLSGYTAYTMFYALMVWAMARLRYPQWLVLLAMIMGIAAGFMTGSRSAVVILIILGIPMIFTEYPLRSVFKIAGRLIIPVMLFASASLLVKKVPLVEQIGKAYDNFMVRVETNQKSGEQSKRLMLDIWYIQNANYRYPLLGVGLGSTYQGANQLFGVSRYVQEFGYVEGELSRVLLEGGWIIVVLKIILGIIMALQFSFTGFMRWAVWFVVALGQPIVFNPHNAAFLLMGIILIDNIIWRQNLARDKARYEAAKRRNAEGELVAATE